jgi:hypothetical protein
VLKEFVDRVAELAVKAAGPHIVKAPGEPDHVYLIQDENDNGALVKKYADPAPRKHVAGDLLALVDFAKEKQDIENGSLVWYNRNKVVCMLDDATRRDTLTLPLAFSRQILLLFGMEKDGSLFKQPQFLLLAARQFQELHGALRVVGGPAAVSEIRQRPSRGIDRNPR